MRIVKNLLFLTGLLFFSLNGDAQTTWSQHVAPIIFNNCATCHRSGGIAPFSLLTYQDAVANATTINGQVQSGLMPPWPPDVTYSRLAHERVLSAAEKATIAAWVNGGTLQGNPSLAPPTPVFSNNGDLPGTPSLVTQIPAYTSTASTGDVYRCFVLDANQTVDQHITAFEAIPGNRAIVHHVLVYADTTGQSTTLDAADPGPGYTSFGGIGVSSAILLGGWVPGSAPIQFPSGFGVKLPHNAKIVMQIHYPAGTSGSVDSTRVNFFFSPTTTTMRDVSISPVLNHALNIFPALVIPPNTVKSFVEHYSVPPILNVSLLGVAPHMHLLGQNIEAFGVRQGDTQKYIRIPEWDFHWQGFYMFKKIVKISGGTEVYARATYDNTTNNPDNPSNPPQQVVAGERTTDEMMLVYFVYTSYQAGDENIIIDSTSTTAVPPTTYYKGQQMLQPYPVPATDQLITKFYFDTPGIGTLELININGQVAQRFFEQQPIASGYTTMPFSVANLASGIYSLRLRTAAGTQVQQVVIRR